MRNKNESGSTLIEAILALALVTIIVSAVVVAVVSSVGNSQSSSERSTALDYAEEGLDLIRDAKSEDFSGFVATYPAKTPISSNYYCLSDDGVIEDISVCNSTALGGNVESGKYLRKVFIHYNPATGGQDPSGTAKCTGNGIYVSSIVYWNDSKCENGAFCRTVELNSCFYDTSAIAS